MTEAFSAFNPRVQLKLHIRIPFIKRERENKSTDKRKRGKRERWAEETGEERKTVAIWKIIHLV